MKNPVKHECLTSLNKEKHCETGMLNKERKTKYLGFRVEYEQYIQTIQAAESAGISITDYILSKLFSRHDNDDDLNKIQISEPISPSQFIGNMSSKYLKESQQKLEQLNLKRTN